ncbi:hypothetical protein [Tychonema sp. LEGE 07203]|nr:hypothetical protein [Tychonema sp. LEGE 07203]MBE9094711.1 hypothetical protein [Tychonema sp. LEGE 07203]
MAYGLWLMATVNSQQSTVNNQQSCLSATGIDMNPQPLPEQQTDSTN